MDDIYGSELYYYLDSEYLESSKQDNSMRLDLLMENFDDPGVFIVLNRIEDVFPRVISNINSNVISTIISRTE